MKRKVEKPGEKQTKPALRLFRSESPVMALGLAVSYLFRKPAFAQLRFGEWSRVLAGQINRKHYWFVLNASDKIVGFVGWALTSRAIAEAWVESRSGFSDAEAKSGNCIVVNAWSADSRDVNLFLLQAGRQVGQGRDMVYFKRLYQDGTVRPVRLRFNGSATAGRARSLAANGDNEPVPT